MNPFPVIASTLSATHLADFLKATYGLSETGTCSLLRTGINHTYLVQDQDSRCVCRVYSHNWRTEAEIREEIRLLLPLAGFGVPVSHPLPDSAGEFVQRLHAPEGLRFVVLFTFAEGEKVRNLSETMCASIGTLMGRMHLMTHQRELARITYNAHTLTQLPYTYACRHFDESLDEMRFVKKVGEYLEKVFADAEKHSLHRGIVHLDIWYDNMSIQDENTITLFDFDFCGNGWLVLDVAYFVMQLFHTTPDKEAFKMKAEAFYRGYGQKVPLSDAEKQLIPYAGLAIWIFYLGVQSQRFENWSNIFLTENYLRHYIGLAKNWMEFNGIDVE
jgi:Ser/Thr protein kinase RdoA (MazF antagonist)